jgi:hypothetical protein
MTIFILKEYYSIIKKDELFRNFCKLKKEFEKKNLNTIDYIDIEFKKK